MESLQISTELIAEHEVNKFGNMSFYKMGNIVINKNMIGLYFTIFLICGLFAVISYLIFEMFDDKLIKIIVMSILSVSTCILLLQTFYVSFSNPGFIKPELRDLEKDATLSNVHKI